jgi:hypothetical protein
VYKVCEQGLCTESGKPRICAVKIAPCSIIMRGLTPLERVQSPGFLLQGLPGCGEAPFGNLPGIPPTRHEPRWRIREDPLKKIAWQAQMSPRPHVGVKRFSPGGPPELFTSTGASLKGARGISGRGPPGPHKSVKKEARGLGTLKG